MKFISHEIDDGGYLGNSHEIDDGGYLGNILQLHVSMYIDLMCGSFHVICSNAKLPIELHELIPC